jgi:CRP-like cAMP-binding protein
LTHVEKIHYLRRSSFFARLGIQEAHVVAKSAVARRYADGDAVFDRGDYADALYCVIDGVVELGGPVARAASAGEVFGETGLRGEYLRPARAVSRGARVLAIANAPLLVEARNHSRIAAVVFRNALDLEARSA